MSHHHLQSCSGGEIVGVELTERLRPGSPEARQRLKKTNSSRPLNKSTETFERVVFELCEAINQLRRDGGAARDERGRTSDCAQQGNNDGRRLGEF